MFGKTVRVEIGQPLSWEVLREQGGRNQLTRYLYDEVQSLQSQSLSA